MGGKFVKWRKNDALWFDEFFFSHASTILINFLILGAFYTRFASEIESDPVGEYTRASMVMQELDIDPDEVTL